MSTRDLVLCSLFAAIIAVLGLIPPIPTGFLPVPITAQSMGVMMAGVVLGAKRGTISVLMFLLLVAMGLPVLSGGRGGLGMFSGPTVGYLIGWVLAAFVTGYLCEKLISAQQSAFVQTSTFFLSAVLGGIVVLYAIGIPFSAVISDVSLSKAFLGSMIFIPGDMIKAVLAALVGRTVLTGYPLLPQRA